MKTTAGKSDKHSGSKAVANDERKPTSVQRTLANVNKHKAIGMKSVGEMQMKTRVSKPGKDNRNRLADNSFQTTKYRAQLLPISVSNHISALEPNSLEDLIYASERNVAQRARNRLINPEPAKQLHAAITPDYRLKGRLESIESQQLGSVNVVQLRKMPFEKIRDAAYKGLRAWVSPEIVPWSKNRGLKLVVTGILRGIGKEYDDEDIDAIVKFINSYEKKIAKITPTKFDSFIETLGKYGGNKNYVAYLQSMQWPDGKKPSVVFGRAVTTAFYDTAKHVITLDPWKLETWTQILDALTFECQNALQRKALKEASKQGGGKMAAAEYESDKMYINALMKINKAENLDDLVKILKIPQVYLLPADYQKSLEIKMVERPTREKLPEQDKRQALWWWKTKSWPDEQRKKMWMLENHGEGIVSSVGLYVR